MDLKVFNEDWWSDIYGSTNLFEVKGQEHNCKLKHLCVALNIYLDNGTLGFISYNSCGSMMLEENQCVYVKWLIRTLLSSVVDDIWEG